MQEQTISLVVVFGTALLVGMGVVMVSFVFLYQKKKYRHQQELTQMQETFAHEMLHSKTEIQEQTLQYVAAEIHDNFNPTLSVINLNLAGIIPAVEEPVKETVVDTKVMVKLLMGEMRTMSKNLNTNEINCIGFVAMLERYIERIRRSGIYTVEFNATRTIRCLSAEKEIILFRICQEILNNIVKHADAQNIYINIVGNDKQYTVQIKDDGKGFDLPAVTKDPEKQDSSGLRNLRNRAAVINAVLDIETAPSQGTTITIHVQ